MIDLGDVLKNDTVSDFFQKLGVPQDKVEQVTSLATNSLAGVAAKDPKKMLGLLSANKNTNEEEVLSKEVENDFIQGLIDKVGLPTAVVEKIKNSFPDLVKQFSGPISEKLSSFGGADMLNKVTDMFGAGDSKQKSGGIKGMLSGLFGK